MASSTASPIMSLVISMRSFCRSNSISTFCMLGRFSRRFMTRMACGGSEGEAEGSRESVRACARVLECTGSWRCGGQGQGFYYQVGCN